MSTITGTSSNDAWTVAKAGTFTLNGLGGVDTLYLGTSLKSEYIVTTQSDGVHVDSVSGASAALHATLQNMEVLVYNNGRDYQGIGGQEVAYFNGSTSAMYNKSLASFNFSPLSNGYMAQPKDGSPLFTFTNIQRIQFNDQNLALDFANNGNATLVAQTLGAVFGASAINNPVYAGIGLKAADQDTNTNPSVKLQDLMQLALSAVFPNTKPTNAQVVDTLYTAVLGSHPTTAQAQQYINMLDSGAYTPASLGAMAAQFVNLTGVIHNGLPYSGYNL